jgi:hypothetical protein
MTALDFLKSKGLIKDGFNGLIIRGKFRQIELTKLLKEYAEAINDGKNGEGMDLVRDFNKAFRNKNKTK